MVCVEQARNVLERREFMLQSSYQDTSQFFEGVNQGPDSSSSKTIH